MLGAETVARSADDPQQPGGLACRRPTDLTTISAALAPPAPQQSIRHGDVSSGWARDPIMLSANICRAEGRRSVGAAADPRWDARPAGRRIPAPLRKRVSYPSSDRGQRTVPTPSGSSARSEYQRRGLIPNRGAPFGRQDTTRGIACLASAIIHHLSPTAPAESRTLTATAADNCVAWVNPNRHAHTT